MRRSPGSRHPFTRSRAGESFDAKGTEVVRSDDGTNAPAQPMGRARHRLASTGVMLGALGLVAGMLQVASILPASAATPVTFFVTPTGTGVATGATACTKAPPAEPACSLPTAITQANTDNDGYTIMLANGTYTAAVTGFTITGSQNWVGASQTGVIITIATPATAPIITVSGGTDSLKTLSIVGPTGGDKGGLSNAVGTTGLTLTTVTVSKNDPAVNGGGILNSAPLTLSGVTVTNNTATTNGGGIANTSTGTLSLSGTTVSSNTATAGAGGGINNSGIITTPTMSTASTITGNTAATNGGGINNASGGSLTAKGLVVNSNKATAGNGGGVANEASATALSLTDGNIGAQFANNTAPGAAALGGGLYNGDTTAKALLNGVSIAYNTVGLNGGGVANAGLLGITGGSISNNDATMNGGGVYNDFLPGVSLAGGVSISNNDATMNGGGVFDDTAGGGILMTGGTLSGNVATGDGGGAYIDTSAAAAVDTFDGVSISSNQATGGDGGGIDQVLGGLVIGLSGTTTSSVTGNTAGTTTTAGAGGGIFLTSSSGAGCSMTTVPSTSSLTNLGTYDVCIDSTTFSVNTADPGTGNTGVGGAIDNDGANLLLTNSNLSTNAASTTGAGLNEAAGNSEIVNTTIFDNTITSGNSTQQGAGIFAANLVYLYYSTLDSNTISYTTTGSTTEDGAGAYLSGTGTSYFTNDTITNNTGANEGGGVFNSAGTLNLTNDTFAFNEASNPSIGPPSPALGGALFTGGGTVTTHGTIYSGDEVANGTGGFNDNECDGTAPTSQGDNLDAGSSCKFHTASTDKSGANADLGTYGTNGGVAGTNNYALNTGSAALAPNAETSGCPVYAQNSASNTQTRVVNNCDIGSWDNFGVSIVSGGTPGAPSGLTATPGDGQATFSWTAPTTGGAPTSYTVTCNPGSETGTVNGTPPATTTTVSGLTNGTTYTCSVTATNTSGTSPASGTTTVVPASTLTAPGAPTGLTASPGSGQATFTWTAPT
ncbi:MAG: beta strand repeat-containing protein, partial [Acidimicrobiales bacterium]